MGLRLTRWGHSCVRIERDGYVVVVDPGTLSDTARALGGADEVLVTHEHADHLDAAVLVPLTRSGLRVSGPPPAVAQLVEAGADSAALRTLGVGDTFSLGPFSVQVTGGSHALLHPDVPIVANLAYVVDGVVLHPGDSFSPPPAPVDVLLLPVGGPWVAVRDAIEYARAVSPARVVPIHDGHLNDTGRALTYALVDRLAPGELVALGPGEGVSVG